MEASMVGTISMERNMNRLFGIALLMSIVGMVGCSPILYEGRYDYDDGWRRGVVVELGTAGSITRVARVDCRNETELVPNAQYAYVKRRHTEDFWNPRIVPVPADVQLAPRDRVLVNIQQCRELVLTRRTK